MRRVKNVPKNALWQRIISVLLAVSLLLIPVRFPEAANATQEGSATVSGPVNYLSDDFSDGRYADGLTVKYNTTNGNWNIADGKLTETASAACNWLYLESYDASGNDYSSSWSNFTAEFSYSRDLLDASAQADPKEQYVRFWIRKSDASTAHKEASLGYIVQIASDNDRDGDSTLALIKSWYDPAQNKIVETVIPGYKDWPTANGTQYAVKVEVAGNSIKVYYGGVLAIDWTDDGVTYGAAYTSGKVGFDLHGNYASNYATVFDYLRISSADGKLVISDDFSDDRYMEGVVCRYQKDTDLIYQYKTVNGNWSVADGKLTETSTAACNWLCLEAVDAQGNNYSGEWGDFSAEFSFSRNLLGADAQANPKAQYIRFWIRKSNDLTANKEVSLGYVIQLADDGDKDGDSTLALIKSWYDPAQNKIVETVIPGYKDRPTVPGTEYDIKVEAIGNNIKVYYDGALVINWTDDGATYGPVHTSGRIAIDLHNNNGANYPTVLDNFRVTPYGGTPVVEDTFEDDRYFNGVVYTNYQDLGLTYYYKTDYGVWSVAGGKLEEKANSYMNWLYLKAKDAEGNDISDQWTDFTTEVTYRRNLLNGQTTLKGQQVNYWFRKAAEGEKTLGYYVSLTGGNTTTGTLAIRKGYMNGETWTDAVAQKNGTNVAASVPTGHGAEHTIKIEAVGANIKVYYDGVLKLDWTDNGETLGPVYTSGIIGIDLHSNNGEDYSTSLDNFSVTPYGGTAVVKDSFDDDRYFNGVSCADYPGTSLSKEYSYTTVNGNWVVADGKLTETATTQHCNWLYLKAKDAEGNDISNQWADFTTEVSLSRNLLNDDAVAAPDSQYVRFWIRKSESVSSCNTVTLGYYVQISDIKSETNRSNMALLKCWENSNGTISTQAVTNTVGIDTQYGKGYPLKIEAVGNTIKVYYDNTLKLTYIDDGTTYGPVHTSGMIGIDLHGKKDGSKYSATLDNFSVTPYGGNTVITDDFDDDLYFTGADRNGNPVGGSWNVKDGKLNAQTYRNPSVLTASQIAANGIDLHEALKDYALDVDFTHISGADASTSLLARVNKTAAGYSYYELRVSAGKVGLYKVVNNTAELLREAEKTVILTDIHNMKLEVKENVLTAYFNGVEILSHTDNADPILSGSAGLRVGAYTEAAFDNFAVYPIEAGKARIFTTYTFEDLAEMASDWDVSGEWKVENKLLIHTGSDTGIAALKSRKSAADYAAVTEAKLVENGSFSVLGRCVTAEKTYYQLELDEKEGLRLYKSVNGEKGSALRAASLTELYVAGVLVYANQTYTLKLQMYGSVIEGYVNGVKIFTYTDAESIRAGVAGVMTAAAGTEFSYLAVGEVDALSKIEIMEDTNRNGKDENLVDHLVPFTGALEVPVGKVPDIKWLYLKLTYCNGNVKYIPMDTAQITPWDVDAEGEKTATIAYQGQTVALEYSVVDRSAAVQQLNADIAQLLNDLTIADKVVVWDLVDRYNDLTAAEKANITNNNKEKLKNAEETIELLLYPELEGTEIVYSESFDDKSVIDQFYSDPSKTGNRNWGFWYVENGMLLQYSSDDYKGRTGSLETSAVLKGKNFQIHSVSVDAQIIDRNVWLGIDFGIQGTERYRFFICDKTNVGGGNRIQLYKNSTLVGAKVQADPEEFWQPGQWINLKVTYIDGVIRCYVDDVLWISYEEVLTVANDTALNIGTVGLNCCEGWGKFDNLVVRGVALESNEQDPFEKDMVSDETYTDDFEAQEDVAGGDPSHWIETNQQDRTDNRWTVKEDGENHVYGSNGGVADDFAMTWLHVFETNVDYSLRARVTELGHYPVFGLLSRFNAEESYIKAGYDFTLQKYFIKVRLGTDFEETTVYSTNSYTIARNEWVYLKLINNGKELELLAGAAENEMQTVVQADAGDKVMPGRVGVYTERCDLDMDDVKLILVSGQGHVQDGVLEYQPTVEEINAINFQVIQLPDGTLLTVSGNNKSTSADGEIWQVTNAYSFKFATLIELDVEKNWYLAVKYDEIKDGGGNWIQSPAGKNAYGYSAYVSKDGCVSWEKVGTLPVDLAYYAQPAEHLNVVKLLDGTVRVFYTAGKQSDFETDTVDRWVLSETFYADVPAEGGEWVWYQADNSPQDFTNLAAWCESHIIMISKDVVDATGTVIPKGTLIQYCSYNDDYCMRYSLSYDGGKTWVGDYAMPQFPCGRQSSVVKEDPYDPGTYYMVTVYNRPKDWADSFPRYRISMFKSTDGYNWEFLCDVDRWGDLKNGGMSELMQNMNMYLSFSEDYIFPQFSHSEQFLANAGNSHHLQESGYYRFEKAKLTAQKWPEEYNINGKDIVTIKGAEEDIVLNRNGKELAFTVYYYDGTSENVTVDEAFVSGLDTSKLGEQTVTIDYKHFRTIFTVNVVKGDAPVIFGVENGKTYCDARTVTVTDANGDLESVTLNGVAVTLDNGKFTVSGKEGVQTIVATDKAGNTTTVVITVNADHTWSEGYITENGQHWKTCTVDGCEATTTKTNCSGGEADCEHKAVCGVCGSEYGEKNADKHTKGAKWTITGDKHSKAYECCGAVVVAEGTHTGGTATCEHKAVCSVCNAEYGKLADHTGGTATCTDKAKCDVCGEAYGEKNADKHTKEAKWTITADKHSKAYECCGAVVVEEAAHTGGEATCEHKAKCEVCNAEYGKLADHKGGEATCCDKAVCDVCGEAYGEKNADKHTKEAKWTITGDKHSKAYECCGKVVVAEEAHEWKDGKCEECGYEAAPGTEQKPIEIPADKETVKEEAKVEAGDELHYELDEKMAGMTITIKGEGAYAIIEGKKYEAVNGVLEVKLPAKTGKIPVIIGNAGTKAGTFSITIATPSEDNSDTGDNTAIVLFGSLMALSVLAAGALLIPDIRKKLMR